MTSAIRQVNSYNPTLNLPFDAPQQRPGDKPNGLWYGIGDSWTTWVAAHCRDLMEAHDFAIQVDTSRLCVLDSCSALEAFVEEMAVPLSGRPSNLIDWEKVASRYAGIEITDEALKYANTYRWLEDWAAASGCIWDCQAVRPYPEVNNSEINPAAGRLPEKI